MKLKLTSCALAALIFTFNQPAQAHDIVVTNGAIEQSLTGQAGDPAKGRKIAIHRKKGNCLACHTMPIPEQQFHGEVGPDLDGVGSRYSIAELRAQVVDAKIANPDSFMPAFHRNKALHGGENLHRVLKGFKQKTILSAQEVEDVVAYLATLTE